MVKLFKEWEGVACHLYKDEERPWVDYTSVSTLKKHYSIPFDSEGMALAKSEDAGYEHFGKTPEEIKSIWNQTADYGKEHGTEVHEVIEKWIESGFKYQGIGGHEKELLRWFSSIAREIGYQELLVESEKATWLDICSKDRKWTRNVIANSEFNEVYNAIIETGRVEDLHKLKYDLVHNFVSTACFYLLDVGLAGTIDILREGKYHDFIDDIKTDQVKSMKHESYFIKGTRQRKMMTGVMSHLMDCSLEQYFLQVNLYGLMNRFQAGRPFGGGWIIHIPKEHNGYKLASKIKVLDRSKECLSVLKDYFFNQTH